METFRLISDENKNLQGTQIGEIRKWNGLNMLKTEKGWQVAHTKAVTQSEKRYEDIVMKIKELLKM